MKEQEQGESFATNKNEIIKAIGEEEFDLKYGKREDFVVEVYTTRHYVSAAMIYEYIDKFIELKNARERVANSLGNILNFDESQNEPEGPGEH